MIIKIQLVFAGDDDRPEAVEQVALFEKGDSRPEDLGLALEESKELLKNLQHRIVERQAATYAEHHRACDHCGKACRRKGFTTVTFRTLFGNIELQNG